MTFYYLFFSESSANRLRKLKILVGDDVTYQLCAYLQGAVPNNGTAKIPCTRHVAGSYVKIEKMKLTQSEVGILSGYDYLSMCQVFVSGYLAESKNFCLFSYS